MCLNIFRGQLLFFYFSFTLKAMRESEDSLHIVNRVACMRISTQEVSNAFPDLHACDLTFHSPFPMDSSERHGVLVWVILRWLALTCCNWVGVVKKINYLDSRLLCPWFACTVAVSVTSNGPRGGLKRAKQPSQAGWPGGDPLGGELTDTGNETIYFTVTDKSFKSQRG